MRYQNPLYGLVSHGAPGTPKARRGSSSGGSIKQACSDSGAGAAEGCQNCQRLADDIKRLMLEKQELLSDVISTNQAYMRLQRDHTALLQQVAELKHKQHKQQQDQMLFEQQQQSQHLWIKDPAEVSDMVPEQHQHNRADAPRVSISSMIGRLISADEPKYAASLPDMSPAAGAATADPAFAAAADELVTPRLEPASSPVKRRRARWNKAAPLRNSLKSLGDMLSPAQATSSGGCYPSAGMFSANSNFGPKPCPVTPPRSPKGAPRSPRGFSRLRASFSGRISFSSGRLSFSGSRLGRRSREAGTSACAEVIDVSVLTQMNTISNSGAGRTPIARVRGSSGGGVSTDAAANASLAATPPGGVTAIGDSFKSVSSVRHSVDCIATSAFSTSSSGGGRSSSANGRNALRHSTDSLQNLKSDSAGMNSLASKLGLSVRTRRSASFVPGSFSAESTDAGAGRQSSHTYAVTTTDALAAFGSPTEAISSAGGWSSITAAAVAPAAAAVSSAGGCTSIAAIAGSAGGSSVFSQSQAVPSTRSSFAGPGTFVNRHGVTTVLSTAMPNHSSSGGRSNGPRRSSFAADGPALPPLHSSINNNRYNSAQSHDSASSCCSHRLTGSGVSDIGAAEPAVTAAGAQSAQDSKARSASSSVAGSSSGSSGGKGFKPSHLRPVSPKSRALKDLASPTADTSSSSAAADAPATAVADASAVAAIEMITAAVAAEGGEIFFDAADGSALVLDSAPTMAATDAAAAEPSAATDTKAAAAVKAAAAKGTYNVADAVAELLQPISNPSNAKQVTFLTSRKYGSKRSSFSSATAPTAEESTGTQSGLSTSPNQPYFGRVWDKWSKMKLGSPRAGRKAHILADGTDSPIATAAAAVAAAAAEDGDTAVAAAAPDGGVWTAEQTQAAAATAAAVEAAALELGMLPAVSTAETDFAAGAAGTAAAAADISLAAAATAAATAGKGAPGPFDSATKAGAKVVAWPLELDEDELVSRRPSVVA